jgi:hypothetical protein
VVPSFLSRRAAYDLSEQRFSGIASPLMLFIVGQIRHRAKPSGLRFDSDDARPADSRSLCLSLRLCYRVAEDGRSWSRFLCRDDPHRNGDRGLALWRALPAVIGMDNDWRLVGTGKD